MNDIDHIMSVLDQRPSAGLAALARHARRELADIPTIDAWDLESLDSPYAVSGLLEHSDEKLMVRSYTAGVGGLVCAIKQSEDGRKARWYPAAMLLWWCLHVDPERLRPRDARIIQNWATAADAERGRGTQQSASKGHAVVHGTTEEKEARWSDLQARVQAKLADNPKLSLTEARRRVANDTGWSYTTVRRHTAR